MFAANVRGVMADSLGVGTTDCSYFDYLKIEKCRKVLKKVQKLQRKLDTCLLELTKDIDSENKVTEDILDRLRQVSETEEFKVIDEIGGSLDDLRNLRLIALIATEQDSFQSFLDNTFALYDSHLGNSSVSSESMNNILQTLLFLNAKEAKEVVDAASVDGVVSKADLKEYLVSKKGNYVKIIKCCQGALLGVMDDFLAMSALMTKRMEKVAETGSKFLTSGKEAMSDVSASVKASTEKVSDVFNSAVTSLHKRTGSRSEQEKKME